MASNIDKVKRLKEIGELTNSIQRSEQVQALFTEDIAEMKLADVPRMIIGFQTLIETFTITPDDLRLDSAMLRSMASLVDKIAELLGQ